MMEFIVICAVKHVGKAKEHEVHHRTDKASASGVGSIWPRAFLPTITNATNLCTLTKANDVQSIEITLFAH